MTTSELFKKVSAIVELCRPVSGCVGQGSSEREKRAQRWAQYRFWELSQCFAEQILQSPGLCQRSHEAENQCSEFSEFSERQPIRQEGSQNNRAAVVRIHGDVMAAKTSAGQRSKIRAVRPTSCVILMALLFVTFASKVDRRFQRGDSPKQSRFLRTLSASSKVSPGAMINFARN